MYLKETFFLWSISILLNQDGLALPKGTRVAVRFDKFEWFVNQMFGQTKEINIKRNGGADLVDIFLTFDFDFIIQKVSLEVIMCKEHYIDCVNYRSFEVANFCENDKTISYFAKIGYSNQKMSCTFQKGPYIFKNSTINLDTITKSFALNSDKWWEKTWKFRVDYYFNITLLAMRHYGDVQILLLSNRTRRY
ncbi:uncharacterized protein LOC126899265 [Daktulosphaira vitifoliae]|uniref:uncharacterized protein LOC126899265 n=1 Tax=Daktulosphaira vitifoliae TaxID=58002 RepID=UPI0021AABAD0|nr:uncharacterized protein LOC126899265 [Daktulosphaira vitifoliae]